MRLIICSHLNLRIVLSGRKANMCNAVLPIRLIAVATWQFDSYANYTHNDFEKRDKSYFLHVPLRVFKSCYYCIFVLCSEGKQSETGLSGMLTADVIF